MPRPRPVILAALLLLAACATGPEPDRDRPDVDPGATRDGYSREKIRPEEIAAVWVDSWNPGLFDAAQIDRLVDWCRAEGINTILAEVRKVGDAYYDSRLEPRGVDATGARIPLSFDPLGHLLRRARSRGIRVEAWLVANRVWKDEAPPPITLPEHLMTRRPEWLLRDRAGRIRAEGDPSVYLDPSDPEARAWVAEVAADLVRRYPVDAVHLDYIRYPGREWGYGERSLARFAAASGRSGSPAPDDPEFGAWRREQVTRELEEIRTAIRAVDPEIELSAATITWDEMGAGSYEATRGHGAVFQDWPMWCRTGLIDVNYPMHYKREHDERWRRDYRRWLDFFESVRREGRARIVVGVGAYMNDPEGTAAQLREARARALDGTAIFSYHAPRR
ncbi:MAG: family 10 glycosylhydrolase [Planctomycetota bacterium]